MKRERHIPKDSEEVKHPDGLGVCYLTLTPDASDGGRAEVCAYSGRKTRPDFYYRYTSEERARRRIAEFFASLSEWQTVKTKRRAERSAPHTLKVGEILHYSWGYDQTNCEFYQIISTTAHTITMREIAARSAGNPGGSSMSDRLLAVKDSFLDKPAETHHADGCNYVPMKFGCASLWDGRPCYSSWYA